MLVAQEAEHQCRAQLVVFLGVDYSGPFRQARVLNAEPASKCRDWIYKAILVIKLPSYTNHQLSGSARQHRSAGKSEEPLLNTKAATVQLQNTGISKAGLANSPGIPCEVLVPEPQLGHARVRTLATLWRVNVLIS